MQAFAGGKSNVIQFHTKRRHSTAGRTSDIVRALERLLDDARDNKFTGLLVVAEGPDKHHVDALGTYNDDIEHAAQAAFALINAIHLAE